MIPRSGTTVPLDRPLLANRSYIAKRNRDSESKEQSVYGSHESLNNKHTLSSAKKTSMHRFGQN